jgi:hypothetical protein
MSCDSKDCYACQFGRVGGNGDTRAAFLAGMAFLLSHNRPAIQARLCSPCQGVVAEGIKACAGAVAPEDRRRGTFL